MLTDSAISFCCRKEEKMRLCLIAEGCYPYVAGGVSSWIQMLIKGLPEYEFIIYAIGAQKSQKGEYKYQIPDNGYHGDPVRHILKFIFCNLFFFFHIRYLQDF